MGEMADFAIDDVAEFENRRELYHSGAMSDYEAYENGFLDPAGDLTAFAGEYSDYSSVSTPETLEREILAAESMLDGNSGFFSGLGYSFETIKMTEAVPILSKNEEVALFKRTLLEKYSVKFTDKILDGFELNGVHEVDGLSKDELSQLLDGIKNNYPLCYEGLNHILYTLTGHMLTGTTSVNQEAVQYAEQRENPTCNICHGEMSARTGIYGKFYFCANQCEGQGTVSDGYWQDFKRRVKSCKTKV